ncbi:MAG TPA: hypothetical protein VFG21_03460 [Xanthomonadaceae bacterium]|nr:hypothetical protein [Xanthomonadaceae bacterium]
MATQTTPSNSIGKHVGAAASDLKDAATMTGAAMRDSAKAGALRAKTAATDSLEAVANKSRELMDSTGQLIRERPLAAFGVALAAGWLIAKILSSPRRDE